MSKETQVAAKRKVIVVHENEIRSRTRLIERLTNEIAELLGEEQR
jgi:hypothetical protein